MKRIAAVVVLCALAGVARADDNFSLDASSRAVHVGFDGPVGRVSQDSQAAWEAGGLFHEQDNANFNEGYVGIKVIGNMGVSPASVDAGLGLRGLYFNAPSANGEAVAIQGEINAHPPGLNRLVFTVAGAYAPDPLAFGDAREYAELDLSTGYEVLHHARIYAGYRNVGVDFGGGRHTVDNGFLGGVRLTF